MVDQVFQEIGDVESYGFLAVTQGVVFQIFDDGAAGLYHLNLSHKLQSENFEGGGEESITINVFQGFKIMLTVLQIIVNGQTLSQPLLIKGKTNLFGLRLLFPVNPLLQRQINLI